MWTKHKQPEPGSVLSQLIGMHNQVVDQANSPSATETDKEALRRIMSEPTFEKVRDAAIRENERKSSPETRDIGVVGPVDGMNNLSSQGPYFRIVLMTGDNKNRTEHLISKGAAEELRDTLTALLKPPSLYTDEYFDSFEA